MHREFKKGGEMIDRPYRRSLNPEESSRYAGRAAVR
jgi:hypothetical protein